MLVGRSATDADTTLVIPCIAVPFFIVMPFESRSCMSSGSPDASYVMLAVSVCIAFVVSAYTSMSPAGQMASPVSFQVLNCDATGVTNGAVYELFGSAASSGQPPEPEPASICTTALPPDFTHVPDMQS